jgi:hypothetical protein
MGTGTNPLEMTNETKTVWVCFDAEGYDVVGIYESKAEAQRHMIHTYIKELKRMEDNGRPYSYDDISYDLETMLDGFIESLFYIEEHEVKTSFEKE